MQNELEKKDFKAQWIFAQYELGKPVAGIAAELKISEAKVYAVMRQRPKTYEEAKRAREELTGQRVRRISGLTDDFVLAYMEYQQKKKDTPGFADEAMEKAFSDIERVMRIGKLYAERRQLTEGGGGRNMNVIGNEIPLQVIIHKTYDKDVPGSD